MPPKSPDVKSVPEPSTNRRAVASVTFIRPVDIEGLGWQRRLEAGGKVKINSQPTSPEVPVPTIWRDGDTGELVIGDSRYPIQGGVVESYKLALAAKSPAK